MDFGMMPPEVISALIYAGPGPESMVAASVAWQQLAAELRATAGGYTAAITTLTGEGWQGPSSAAMAAAAQPVIAWLTTTAAHAEHTAGQAQAAATAFETVFAAVVPPPLIAANRARLATLQASNVLGQNTAAIAATETEYAAMWAQDAAAMSGYAAESVAASRLTPFIPPKPAANPAGPAQPAAQAAAAGARSALPQAMNLAQSSPLAAPNPLQSLSTIAADVELIPKAILPFNDAAISVLMGLGLGTRAVQKGRPPATAGPRVPVVVSATRPVEWPTVSAQLGRAPVVGRLAVPPSWTVATPEIRLAAGALQDSGAATTGVPAGVLGQVAGAGAVGSALGGMTERAVGGTVARVGRLGGSGKDTPEKLKKVLAELSAKPESVQHWHTDQADLESLLARLAKQPGIHAVHLSSGDTAKLVPPESSPGT
ncbi:PPE family protein [Mycobacterium sp. 1274756.6]|uniref:PPE family protein n=1 Tax=Mycobacterium sp. 1274756.6 TaxID=1834076 RepID=UPI0007FCE345|nr:PPE family protein [Mycobacterium sp. 1274756.6]OBJ71412.1 hypothetical protein A5643_07590 [Mycobacterium sp. 1274756.6]